jgi:gas vesicle protein
MSDFTKIPEQPCTSISFARKLMYLLIGGGLGAGVALMFAPKSGRELREDITDVVNDGYVRTLETANQLKSRGVEYYESAKETGNEVFEVVTTGMSAVGEEIREDAAKINEIITSKRRTGPPNVL